jgi:hypothetical protein
MLCLDASVLQCLALSVSYVLRASVNRAQLVSWEGRVLFCMCVCATVMRLVPYACGTLPFTAVVFCVLISQRTD